MILFIMQGKKAYVEFVGLGIVLTVVLLSGMMILINQDVQPTGLASGNILEYVGNLDTKKVCSLNNSDYSKIPVESRVFFITLDDAINKGFIYSPNCE